MTRKEELFFKNLIVAEGIKSLYWNNKRYSKEDIFKIKQLIKSSTFLYMYGKVSS
tara:strand:+ start:402 stop:566 length:165 start_codon:yes stop_codon:yes gene_type:complete